MASTPAPPPPPYYPTIYDETLRSIHYASPSILSIANSPNLLGKLEYHSPATDGSFSVRIANGSGVFISQALLESIPADHRPALNRAHTDEVQTLTVGVLRSIGATLIPVILTNADTGENFRIVLHAIVLPNLFIHMFIGGRGSPILRVSQCSAGVPVFGFSFGGNDNELTRVRGI